ncbi:hypothetical protein EVA_02836 [gut metagenome]|uniref:Uncharacterized protein n=1 Tax=gut metagenome TaxID=749906 RepID=J9H598_9ZZZZ
MNPRDYLNDIIAQMPYHKNTAYDEQVQQKNSDCNY